MAKAINFARPLAIAALALVASQASAEAFNGPYVGAQIGWQQDKLKGNDWSAKADGFSYGGFIGYNAKVTPNVVLGLEAGLSGTDGNFDWGDNGDANVGTRWDLTARAGYLVTPSTLAYVRGGYTNQKYTEVWQGEDYSNNQDGFTVGAGIEQAVTANVSARVQYDYAKYSNIDWDGDVRPTAHGVKVGVSYNF